MKCAQVKKLLPLFTSGELGPEEQRAIKEHVARCARCQKEAGEYTVLLEAAGGIGSVETPPGFHEEFLRETMNRVAGGPDRAPERGRARRVPAARRWRYALAGAAVVILVAAVWIFIAVYPDQSRLAQGPSLEEYLERADFRGLSEALSHEGTRTALLEESVSVDLLIRSVERLKRTHTRRGHVRQHLARSILEAQGNTTASLDFPVPSAVSSSASLKVMCANINKEDVHLDNVLRALMWYRQTGDRITLKTMISVLNACKQT
jgi:hypothetical protein